MRFSSSSTTLTAAAATSYQCPPLGAVLPKAKAPSTHPAVRAAVAAFTASLETETAAFNGSAVSIGVKSALEDAPRDRDPRGAQAVDRHTAYRLASVSKLFSVLAALQHGDVIGWEDPLTKFIPELRDAPKGVLDHFELTYGDDGRVESVLPKPFALTLTRVEEEGGSPPALFFQG
ncbi:hypothetical protein CGRA01v4_09437 [Colletotrichum graminicola]|uniref:Beta-lactamase-related domain-containing protein n=1 Tax=Colletotrichum graminicola (strain M1.001 / M2 / FGSC 10212) TaxID=645133 RepID=E3QVW6_COLGM|nr:uncharacterized protein GLRG_10148 [Colletotrichum graminicola M1.001]EFQ35004.1 hypothetical protein GLRG_10148 [Colletotrichum graminicola M1.001]WDK18152.1 hypothetical protein CGRA01v4_09437 [Colletotrichum graminicola]